MTLVVLDVRMEWLNPMTYCVIGGEKRCGTIDGRCMAGSAGTRHKATRNV
jgi:hypothetical protein